jgi:hypothetical protein
MTSELRSRFLKPLLIAIALSAAGPPALVRAQVRAPEVGLGFGVDTTAADVAGIVRLVRAYLANPDSIAHARNLWQSGPPGDHTHDDLAARYALQGAPASVVGVVPTDAGDSVYVVKLLHARARQANGPVSPIALERFYAIRTTHNAFGWQLAAALPRLTHAWRTMAAGRITFHYAFGQQPSLQRAALAGTFVDSVARVFGVALPRHVDYYVTASPDEYFRAIGLDFFAGASGPGQSAAGNALPDAGVLLAGDPAQGELYHHELVHVALGNRIHSGFINEGVAAWLGGSRRQNAVELFRALVAFQHAHPGVTFSTMVRDKLSVPDNPVASSDAWYASGALACAAAFRRDGVRGLRALADAPGDAAETERVLARLLGLPDEAAALDRWWRTAAADASR